PRDVPPRGFRHRALDVSARDRRSETPRERDAPLAALALAPRAQTVEVERGMVDREVVPPVHSSEHRRDDVLGDVLYALTARADEVVMMLGVAGDVRRHVSLALEPASHPVLHLPLEGAIDRGAADGRMTHADALVQLLRRERALRRSERFRDEDALLGAPAPPCGKS